MRLATRVGLTLGLMALAVTPVQAMTLDFNSLADGANNAAVQTYVQGILPGTTVTGSVAEKNFTGDNHIVGPGSGSSYKPITLGTTDAAQGNNTHTINSAHLSGSTLVYDTFLTNKDGVTTITITFSSPVTLRSFDWEIFSDGSCTALTSCGGTGYPNRPDLTVKYNTTNTLFHYYGVKPGDTPFEGGVNPALQNTTATFLDSPVSGSGSELAP